MNRHAGQYRNHQCASADQWPDDARLPDLEDKFVCSTCGKKGADVRPDFGWDKPGALTKSY